MATLVGPQLESDIPRMVLSKNPATGSASGPLDRQVVVPEPHHGWRQLGLGELKAHRELLYFFIWRDLKVRYKQTAFGVSWAVLQPVLLMLAFSASVGRIAGIRPAETPYRLFFFAGLGSFMTSPSRCGVARSWTSWAEMAPASPRC